LHEGFVYALAMRACFLLPGLDGAWVQTKGMDDGLGRTSPRQQRQDDFDRLLVGFELIKDRSFVGDEGLLAGRTLKAIFQTDVQDKVACVLFAP
jgi:hypothetical protein